MSGDQAEAPAAPASQQQTVMIEADGLRKVFGAVVAVDGVTFSAPPGAVTGFLGPNGAGKSTTMRLLLGLNAPTSGRGSINGLPYRQLPRPLRTVGALLDTDEFHPARSARAHLRWMARSNGIPAARVVEALELVGLASVAGRRVGTFSLGMRQRLGLAAALLGDPPILLLDEPFNGLDPEGIAWVRRLLCDRAARGATILLSSHLLSEIAQVAQRLVVIAGGRLIAEGPTGEVVGAAAANTVTVRSARPEALTRLLSGRPGVTVEPAVGPDDALIVTGATKQQVGAAAAADGIAVYELADSGDPLEHAFMQLADANARTGHGPGGTTPPAGSSPYGKDDDR